MDDPILPPEPQQAPQPPAPSQIDVRFERLENSMNELANTVRDAARQLTQSPPPQAPQSPDDFLNRMASDPQGVIRQVAADTFRQAAAETLTPTVMQVLDYGSTQLLSEQAQRVDGEFGIGTFDELFRPQLDKDLAQLRVANPRALADRGTVEALVNRLYGGDNFPVLMERRRNYETLARSKGLSHLVPTGGVPRLRRGDSAEADLPEDVHGFLRDVEKATGEVVDRKHFAKLYQTGVESGPGRHRTTLIEYLKAVGADPDTLKMYGGEKQ